MIELVLYSVTAAVIVALSRMPMLPANFEDVFNDEEQQ